MKHLPKFLLVFLIVSLVLTGSVEIPRVKGQVQSVFGKSDLAEADWVTLELKRPYGFRGEQINLTAVTNYDSVVVEIYLPNSNLWQNDTYNANESRLINIAAQAPFGEYHIVGKIPNAMTGVWFSVVDDENFQATSLPFEKVHKNVTYWVFGNKTLAIVYREQRLSIHIPDLPSAVSINCFNNSDIFVARFSSAVVDVDLSLVFVHGGAKLVINGTSDSQKDFSFQFYSPMQIKKWYNRIKIQKEGLMGTVPNSLFFDWTDFVKVKEHLSYNYTTHTLTVHDVPQTFRLDPSFGVTTEAPTLGSYINNEVKGIHASPASDGTADSITIWLGTFSGSAFAVKCALYEYAASGTTPLIENGVTEERIFGQETHGWQTFNFEGTKPSISAEDEYWIVAWGNGTNYIDLRYETGASGIGFHKQATYDGFPDPITVYTGTREHSVFCNYTTTGEEKNFFGSIQPQYSIGRALSWSFNRYATVTQQFTVTQAATWTFNLYSLITETFTIDNLRAIEFSLYKAILPAWTITEAAAWQFNLFATVNPTFTVLSTAQFIEAGILNFYGAITQTFTLNFLKAVTFSRYVTLSPTFTIESTVLTGAFLNFWGSIIERFTVANQKTVVWTLQSLVSPELVVESVVQAFQPGLIYIYGVINFVQRVRGWTTLPVPELDVALALAAISFILAIISLALLVTKKD